METDYISLWFLQLVIRVDIWLFSWRRRWWYKFTCFLWIIFSCWLTFSQVWTCWWLLHVAYGANFVNPFAIPKTTARYVATTWASSRIQCWCWRNWFFWLYHKSWNWALLYWENWVCEFLEEGTNTWVYPQEHWAVPLHLCYSV